MGSMNTNPINTKLNISVILIRILSLWHINTNNTIRLARQTEGAPPASIAYNGRKNNIKVYVRSLVSTFNFIKRKYISDTINPTCNPDIASKWDNPQYWNNSIVSSDIKESSPNISADTHPKE